MQIKPSDLKGTPVVLQTTMNNLQNIELTRWKILTY